MKNNYRKRKKTARPSSQDARHDARHDARYKVDIIDVCIGGEEPDQESMNFWRKMDQVLLQTDLDESEKAMQFCPILKDAYERDLNILIAAVTNPNNPNEINQACVGPEGLRALICYTNPVFANDDDRIVLGAHAMECFNVSVRFVLNNMFNKRSLSGLLFNQKKGQSIFVPKMLLWMAMPGEKPKPEGFKEF